MSIRPVDLQVMLPKTAEYSKQHQGELNKQSFDQQMYTQTATKEAERQQTAVIQTNESESLIDKDGRNKQEQEGSKRGKRQRTDKETTEEKNKSKTGTGLFDMRI